MKVYILISETFDPSTMEYSDQAIKRIEGVYKNAEDADRRRLNLEHEEALLGLMYPEDEGWTVYYVEEHDIR